MKTVAINEVLCNNCRMPLMETPNGCLFCNPSKEVFPNVKRTNQPWTVYLWPALALIAFAIYAGYLFGVFS